MKKKLKVHRIDVQERLKAIGIENPHQLYKAIGIGRETCGLLWDGAMTMLRLSTLDILCELLECSVQDIIVYDEVETEVEEEVLPPPSITSIEWWR